MLVREGVAPVLLEVAVTDDRTHLEDCFGAPETPSSTGDVHAVFDQVPAGALDDPGGDRPPALEGGGVVEVRPLVDEVAGALIDGRSGGAVKALPGSRTSEGGCNSIGVPLQTARAMSRTQRSASGSPSLKKHQAAFHRYSRTWTKSTTMVTTTWRAWASACMRSIWWLLPSTRATQVRQCSGSRRSASSKTRLTTVAASSARWPSATCCERARRAGRHAPGGGSRPGCRQGCGERARRRRRRRPRPCACGSASRPSRAGWRAWSCSAPRPGRWRRAERPDA